MELDYGDRVVCLFPDKTLPRRGKIDFSGSHVVVRYDNDRYTVPYDMEFVNEYIMLESAYDMRKIFHEE